MNLPYQYLSRLGQSSILCAAKGASIHTFDLEAGNSFLSSWTHPLTKQASSGEPQETSQEGQELNEQESGQRPSKKRKLNEDKKPGAEEGTSQADTGAVETTANGNGKKKHKPDSRVQGPEIPFVALMTATEDGRYLVAVTGQDKTLWVFEHDGKGELKEISQRVMPKRPSSIAITPDGTTILSADKFGDVYSLPLIPTATPPEAPSTPSTPSSAPAPAPSFKPAANRLTVHSQRNLRALEEQERILASRKGEPAKDVPPASKYEPILGHVSMLTALVLATADGRPYIITADRDEHIRVSRGIPQAHVVENYCLGHEAFLNALCVPASRPEVLVSGGGDDELFVWNWKAAQLLGKTDLLPHIKEIVPSAEQVAVSQLLSYDVDERCFILAICEHVPAIFTFEVLPDNTLNHVQTLRLQNSPLNALITTRPESSLKLVVATDPPQPTTDDSTTQTEGDTPMTVAEPTQSLLLFERDETGNWVQKGGIQDIAEGNLDVSRKELETILYTVEHLRKTEFTDDVEGGSAAP
ncbi:tRNA (guanine-N(7)-)-methyltransferase non-catalytic subunit trm82 [Daldinia childiae]|uniref:tRNA (guanine-N(7)-)-methyltransferase non-catalytic subunit trm82 n=1 Tax=Daldinia childiae TaxID=326645 RepID=UPI001444CD49|nr:tRNA (guanine-N(7)-)-methyltransferase non-catalytic subunit trm82 [Daldinia childiae]KAF3056541.1 tRNA (guanine-N(7)-)-methyltransferase non-catalytic subunit trm82 [Daldinia childiae]